uniref:At1g61320/AtMIF1 LRR domain-containing protein n=1 Tax=Oryza rufipogon TaxID=4529 RepID=A0A0E0MYI5_ORYRU
MARFQCEDCGGDDLKKPKLAGHFRSCAQPTGQETVQGHAQCISGAEKYGPPKGQNKASMEIFPSCAGNHLASAATSRQAEGEDRISPLPDNILLLILQELAARVEAIRTCSLSRRWRWLPWLLLEPRISVKKFIPSGVELWMVDKRALDRVAGRFCRAVSRFLAISDATRWLKLMLEFFKNCMNPLFETLSFGIAVDSPRVFGALTKLELRHLQLRSADVARVHARGWSTWRCSTATGVVPGEELVIDVAPGSSALRVLELECCIPKLTRLSVDSWFPDGAPVSLGSVPILADLSLIHGADIRTRPGGGGGELEDPRPLQGSFSKLTVLNLGDGQYELLWMIFFLQAAPFLQNFNLSIQKDMRSRHGRQQETPYCETTCSEFKHKHLKSLKIAGFKVEEKYMEFVRMVMELAMALQTIILTDEESCNYYRPTPTGSRYPKGDREKSSIVKQLMDGITSKVQIFIE